MVAATKIPNFFMSISLHPHAGVPYEPLLVVDLAPMNGLQLRLSHDARARLAAYQPRLESSRLSIYCGRLFAKSCETCAPGRASNTLLRWDSSRQLPLADLHTR